MSKQNKLVTAYLHITKGPSSELIRFQGKGINASFIEITAKNKVVIGRNAQVVDLQIYDLHDDSSISRTHCSIRFDFELKHFMITDEASTNGTYLNKERLVAHEPTQLRHQDTIELGQVDTKGIQFFFALENLNANEAPRRVVVRPDAKPRGTGPLPPLEDVLIAMEDEALVVKAKQDKTVNILGEVDKQLTSRQTEVGDTINDEEFLKLLGEGAILKTDKEFDAARLSKVQVYTKIVAKYDVFISYSRENSDIMKHIYKLLSETYALTVWTDMSLKTGEKWQPEIEKRIADSHCFLILMSPSAKASEWVQNELNYASSYNIPLFPALIEGNEQNAIPIKLIGMQYANLTKNKLETGLARLAEDIQTKLGELKGNTNNK